MKQLQISNKSNNKDTCMSGVYGNQQLYLAPLVEIKDIGSRDIAGKDLKFRRVRAEQLRTV